MPMAQQQKYCIDPQNCPSSDTQPHVGSILNTTHLLKATQVNV